MMMQGDSTFQLGMLAHIKRAHPGIEVIGGNIVTTYQVRRVWRGVEGVDGELMMIMLDLSPINRS